MEYLHEGSPNAVIDDRRAGELVDALLRQLGTLRRVLILPPDITRFHSGAGPLTGVLHERLHGSADVAILPAVGTHVPMTADEIGRMFPGVPRTRFHAHDWRN